MYRGMSRKRREKTPKEAKEKEDSSLGCLCVISEQSVNIKKGEVFTLGGLQVFAEAQQSSSPSSSSSPQSLTIFTCKATSNAVEMYKQRVAQVANEVCVVLCVLCVCVCSQRHIRSSTRLVAAKKIQRRLSLISRLWRCKLGQVVTC